MLQTIQKHISYDMIVIIQNLRVIYPRTKKHICFHSSINDKIASAGQPLDSALTTNRSKTFNFSIDGSKASVRESSSSMAAS